MADTVKVIETKYPLPAFYYRVTIGTDGGHAFSEVSGLSIEYETITYKHGLSHKQGDIHMPGLSSPVNITLKKGIIRKDSFLFNWINTINLNTVKKQDMTISLLDEKDKPVVSWKVVNAFPKKLDAPSFSATSNEVAIESLELMANRLSLEYS